MNDSMSQHCPNCEEQAAEIEAYRRSLYLKQTLISDQAAEIDRLREEINRTYGKAYWSGVEDGKRAALAGKAEQ